MESESMEMDLADPTSGSSSSSDGTLYLVPPPLDGLVGNKNREGKTIVTAFFPGSNTIACSLAWNGVATRTFQEKGKGKESARNLGSSDTNVYLSDFDDFPPTRRPFVASCYTNFAIMRTTAQAFKAEVVGEVSLYGHGKDWNSAFVPDSRGIYARHAQVYLDDLAEYQNILMSEAEIDVTELAKVLHSIHTLKLAKIIYLPGDGRGESPVCEELLDWVNHFDIQPSREEREQVFSKALPYESDLFQPTLICCIVRGLTSVATAYFGSLRDHPDPLISSAASTLDQLILEMPRSRDTDFAGLSQFLTASNAWRGDVRAANQDFEVALNDATLEDEVAGLADALLTVFSILSGRREVLLATCSSWWEALAAWTLYGTPGCLRDDLPDAARYIFEEFPVDPTLPAEVVLSSLLTGDTTKAVVASLELDIWLAAHLADLMDKVELLPDQFADQYDCTLRDYLVMRYVDTLQSDPGLWRIAVDYLRTCGKAGHARMKKKNFQEKDVLRPTTVEDVLQVCISQGLDVEKNVVCRMCARQHLRNRKFGKAIIFSLIAGDDRTVARVVDVLLNEYIEHGSIEFSNLVDEIDPSLLYPEFAALSLPTMKSEPLDFRPHTPLIDDQQDTLDHSSLLEFARRSAAGGLGRSRLHLLASYRKFHGHYALGDRASAAQTLVELITSGLAPRQFYLVLLFDAVPLLEDREMFFTEQDTYQLMANLEEVFGPVATSGRDSAHVLRPLGRMLYRPSSTNDPTDAADAQMQAKAAMRTVHLIRQALARYLARCCMLPGQ